MSDRPIGIDLFCGAGGMSLGFEQAGFDIVAAVDVDPVHCAVHEYNFPLCETICESVANLTGKDLRKRAGIGDKKIDVLFGGAPCQGFSMIGKRMLDDPRNSLVSHFVRLVKELKPKYFVFENVRGLTIGDQKKFLLEIIDSLEEIGYNVERNYQVLNAADYGVPQDRKRLFLIGSEKKLELPKYPLPFTKDHKITVWDAIGDIPDADKFKQLLNEDSVKVKLGKSSYYSSILRNETKDPKDYSYKRLYDREVLTSSMRTIHTDISKQRFEATVPGKTEQISRFLRLNPNGVCNTLRAGTDSERGAHTSPRPIHPKLPRVITVREAARLHSYPDWFRMHVTKWHGFRQVGNSVPPLLARAVASMIIKSMGTEPKKPSSILKLEDSRLLQFNMSQAAAYFEVSSNVIPQRIRKKVSQEEGLNA